MDSTKEKIEATVIEMPNESKEDDVTITLSEENEKKPKLNRNNYFQLLVHGVYLIINLFVSTFLVSFIYSISSNYMVSIGLFYLFSYFSMGILYLIISKFIDKTNRVVFYRISLLIKSAFILMIIFVGKSLAELVILAGTLHGISEACYWTSYNIMKNELVRKSGTKLYSTSQTIIDKVVNIVIPLIFGKIIDADSFKTSAIIVAVVVVIQIGFSFLIKSNRPENSSFELRNFFKDIKGLGERGKLLSHCIVIGGIYGFYTAISPVKTILIMIVFESNFSLGILTSIFSVLSIIFLLIMNRFKVGKRNLMYISCGLLPFIASILLALNINKTFLIIFSVLYTVCQLSFTHPFDVFRNVVIKKLDMYDSIAEFQACIEFTMEMCRTLIFLIMVIFGIVGGLYGESGIVLSAKIFLVLTTFVMPVINFFLIKYEKLAIKNGIF